MKLISHRGNIHGPQIQENSPCYIDTAIGLGFDVEIDVRYDEHLNYWYLGHDFAQYKIEWQWLDVRKNKLWIHCKNLEALRACCNHPDFNFFWHQNDDFTLTSQNYIWTYPGQTHGPKSVIVMPETAYGIEPVKRNFAVMKTYSCYGICSDYVGV
jgi:hypothetical protein